MLNDDPWDDPQAKRWVRHAREKLAPMIEDSNCMVSIAPNASSGPDPKFCVELGMGIMLNKPIIVVAAQRADVPSKLWLIADAVLVGDVSDPEFAAKIATTVKGLQG